MKFFILTIISLLTGIASYCQYNYVKGLIVTQSNDTIMCLVPSSISFEDKVVIKKDAKKQILLTKDIKYLANGNQVFENIRYHKNSREISKLLWLELEGKLNLYGEVETEPDYTLKLRPGVETYFSSLMKTRVIKKNDTTYLIEKDNFTESVKPLIADAPELVSELEAGKFDYNSVKKLVEEYNKLFE